MRSIDRRQIFAGIIAFVVISSGSVIASDHLAVGSQHSSDVEFNNAQNLDNVVVDGDSVLLKTGVTVDGFEDGDTNIETADWNGWNGDTGSFTAESTSALEGDFAGKLISNGQDTSVTASRSSETEKRISFDLRPTSHTSDSFDNRAVRFFDSSGTFVGNIKLDEGSDDITWGPTGDVLVSSWQADRTYEFEIAPDFSTNEATIYVDGESKGTFGLANDVEGIQDVSLTIDTSFSGETSALFIDDLKTITGPSGTYVSQNHTVSDAEKAKVNISIQNANSSVVVEEWTGSEWRNVNKERYSTSGNKTLDISEASFDTLRTNVTFVKKGSEASARLLDESILFTDRDPELASPSPSSGKTVQESPVKLRIDVSDADFATSQGDELTVTFYDESDGSKLGTQTITQNQMVNETFDNPVAGTNEWSVRVEDSYGNVVESQTFSFQTPEVLELRNESAPNNLVTEESNIEVRFFGQESGEVITRTASNGTVDMTGLPVDEPLIASTDVDGYFQRSIAIDSILEQQRMFLLPESADSSQVDWVLDDNSGRFDSGETTLFIERPIEIDGETKYRVIYGEQFGGTGRTASTLATGDRYRLRVENQDGNTRLLGSYLAAGAAQETLTVGSVDFPGLDDTGTAFSAVLDKDDGVIDYRFADDSAETDELTVEIYRNGELVQNSTLSGPIQTVREQVPLSELNHSEGDSYRVEYSAGRNGIVVDGERIVGDVPELAKDWNIDEGLLNILGMVTIVGSFGAVVILSPRHAGLVAFSVAFALSIIGVVAMNQILIGLGFVASGLFAAAGGNP
jgi:hypothetical protein